VFGDVAFAQAPFASQGGKTLASALSESVVTSDAVAVPSVIRGGNVAEVAAAAETVVSLNNIMTAVRAEAGTATAVQNFIASTLNASQAEIATGTDTQIAISTVRGAVSETTTATAAQSAITTVLAAIAELATGSDSSNRGLLVSVAVSETATGTATQAKTTNATASVAELATALATISVVKTLNVNVTGIQLLVTIGDVLVWVVIDDSQNPNWQNIPT